MADRLAGDGWLRLGYKYVNLDDCWAANKRDAQGRLQPNPERFPSGIKALADYVSSIKCICSESFQISLKSAKKKKKLLKIKLLL